MDTSNDSATQRFALGLVVLLGGVDCLTLLIKADSTSGGRQAALAAANALVTNCRCCRCRQQVEELALA